jgi:hypothetical protein
VKINFQDLKYLLAKKNYMLFQNNLTNNPSAEIKAII